MLILLQRNYRRAQAQERPPSFGLRWALSGGTIQSRINANADSPEWRNLRHFSLCFAVPSLGSNLPGEFLQWAYNGTDVLEEKEA